MITVNFYTNDSKIEIKQNCNWAYVIWENSDGKPHRLGRESCFITDGEYKWFVNGKFIGSCSCKRKVKYFECSHPNKYAISYFKFIRFIKNIGRMVYRYMNRM